MQLGDVSLFCPALSPRTVEDASAHPGVIACAHTEADHRVRSKGYGFRV